MSNIDIQNVSPSPIKRSESENKSSESSKTPKPGVLKRGLIAEQLASRNNTMPVSIAYRVEGAGKAISEQIGLADIASRGAHWDIMRFHHITGRNIDIVTDEKTKV